MIQDATPQASVASTQATDTLPALKTEPIVESLSLPDAPPAARAEAPLLDQTVAGGLVIASKHRRHRLINTRRECAAHIIHLSPNHCSIDKHHRKSRSTPPDSADALRTEVMGPPPSIPTDPAYPPLNPSLVRCARTGTNESETTRCCIRSQWCAAQSVRITGTSRLRPSQQSQRQDALCSVSDNQEDVSRYQTSHPQKLQVQSDQPGTFIFSMGFATGGSSDSDATRMLEQDVSARAQRGNLASSSLATCGNAGQCEGRRRDGEMRWVGSYSGSHWHAPTIRAACAQYAGRITRRPSRSARKSQLGLSRGSAQMQKIENR